MSTLQQARWLIEDGETVSTNYLDLREWYVVGYYFPAAFEGTAVTFQACDTAGGTYLAVYDDANTAVSLTVAASRYVSLGSSAAARAAESLPFAKMVAGSQQTGDVEVIVMLAKRTI